MERTKYKNPVTVDQVTTFTLKWGYKTAFDEESNTLHLKRVNPRSKTFYYREAIIEKVIQKFGKPNFKLQ